VPCFREAAPPAAIATGERNMTKPVTPDRGVSYDLERITRELRDEEAYERSGHTARTLVRTSDLRVVVIAIKEGSRIAEHQVNETASVQVVSGNIRLDLPDRQLELGVGQLAILEPGLVHEVEGATDSTFVLTMGWSGKEHNTSRA
jgi:quercetin dioxygenase-like cupin family protein